MWKRGVIKLYDRVSGLGTIGCVGNPDVKFNADRIIAKDKNGLKQGDAVWFKVENTLNDHSAIDIKKCM